MSDRTSTPVGHPSLRESTASCWGLLGSALTWQPEAVATTLQPHGDQGLGVGGRAAVGAPVRVIDLTPAERGMSRARDTAQER